MNPLCAAKNTLRQIRSVFRKWRVDREIQMKGEPVSTQIRDAILSGKPLFVGRFGSIEIDALVQFEKILTRKTQWSADAFKNLKSNAGVFPLEYDVINGFYEKYLESMPMLDVLGSWCSDEIRFHRRFSQALRVPLADLEPYFHEVPWSSALEGKTVLVVHPFVRTIERQYHGNWNKLFPHANVLPDFNLVTIEAIQCIGGNAEYSSWDEVYELMKSKIEAIDFDVAILGCGAFGFPLAAHVKKMGRQAIHLGGATQVMFGIKGKRWESIPAISKFFNDYWCRPLNEEMPENALEIEGGAYW